MEPKEGFFIDLGDIPDPTEQETPPDIEVDKKEPKESAKKEKDDKNKHSYQDSSYRYRSQRLLKILVQNRHAVPHMRSPCYSSIARFTRS